MFPVLAVGGLVIPTAPLVYLLGIYLSLNAIEWAAKSLQLPATRIYELVANAVIAGFIGARLGFILQNFSDFLNEPISIVWPLTNGYYGIAGVAVGILTFWYLIHRSSLPIMQTLDAVVVGVLADVGV